MGYAQIVYPFPVIKMLQISEKKKNDIPQVVSCIGVHVSIQRYSCGKVNYGKFSMSDGAVLAFLLK